MSNPFQNKPDPEPVSIETPQEAEAAVAQAQLRLMARLVRNDAHFRQVLMDSDPCLREQVYNEIKPHLRFTPKPFWLLMA